MSDPRNILQAKFEERHRYANFGDILMRMHVRGFRCHSNTFIDIQSPITAICGLNGTGKSTLLQLAAAAYKKPSTDTMYYNISDFFVIGTLDPHPFSNDATIEYRFWQDSRALKRLTLSRNSATSRWQGYQRRPIRRVFFAGCGLYLPKIEQRDFIVRNSRKLTIENTSAIASHIKEWTSRILGCSYDDIILNTVAYSHRSGKVITVQRSGATYSESHMGYGEARSQYLINVLEILPDKSLILIEEPETSLHPSSQHNFGKYLIDVAIRKCHQILLTTHSEFILESLPSASRVYLDKTPTSIEIIPGLTSHQAKSLMADGHIKALHILVEDECAKAVLSEIIRRIDSNLLRSVGIYSAGDTNTIARTVRTLTDTGLPVIAVRDGDIEDDRTQNIFKLPGTMPPEKEILNNDAVSEYVERIYNVDLSDFLAGIGDVNHHEWFERLASHVNQEKSALMCEVCRVYANSILENEASALVELLKESVRR